MIANKLHRFRIQVMIGFIEKVIGKRARERPITCGLAPRWCSDETSRRAALDVCGHTITIETDIDDAGQSIQEQLLWGCYRSDDNRSGWEYEYTDICDEEMKGSTAIFEEWLRRISNDKE